MQKHFSSGGLALIVGVQNLTRISYRVPGELLIRPILGGCTMIFPS